MSRIPPEGRAKATLICQPTRHKVAVLTLIIVNTSIHTTSCGDRPVRVVASAGLTGYMVIININNMQHTVKINNINQEIMLICLFSFGVGTKSVCSFIRFSNNLEDSMNTETPIIPTMKQGIMSTHDGCDFLVTIIITPGKPITAIAPPMSLPSVKGRCRISYVTCFLIFLI